jgi:hypothetical protein
MEDGINPQIKEDKEEPQEEEKHEGSQTSSGWGGWGFSAFSVLSDLQKKAEEISRNVSLLFFYHSVIRSLKYLLSFWVNEIWVWIYLFSLVLDLVCYGKKCFFLV